MNYSAFPPSKFSLIAAQVFFGQYKLGSRKGTLNMMASAVICVFFNSLAFENLHDRVSRLKDISAANKHGSTNILRSTILH